MLDILHAIILAIVQGTTEFLPVSSSAHLILIPKILGWPDQGLLFDVAVHIGTLVAVVSYFRKDLYNMVRNWHNKLLWAIIFGTIPVGLAGILTKQIFGSNVRSEFIIAITTIVFGILLVIASWCGKQTRYLSDITWQDILCIGLAQAIALIPGTSRSGITLTAGLLCNFTREEAARYSFLLSIPVIFLAGGLEAYKVVKYPSLYTIHWPAIGIGIFIAAIVGYITIHYFLQLLNKIGVIPFVIYRILLGSFLLMVI